MIRDRRNRPWARVLFRSLAVGAAAGMLGGALIFFIFGFIGFSGAPLSVRIENGWEAVVDPGLRKGLVAGLGLAVALAVMVLLWRALAESSAIADSRPWLSALGFVTVVLSNLEWLRTPFGWDVAGLITVGAMGLLVSGVVWSVAPWALDERQVRTERHEPAPQRGLGHG